MNEDVIQSNTAVAPRRHNKLDHLLFPLVAALTISVFAHQRSVTHGETPLAAIILPKGTVTPIGTVTSVYTPPMVLLSNFRDSIVLLTRPDGSRLDCKLRQSYEGARTSIVPISDTVTQTPGEAEKNVTKCSALVDTITSASEAERPVYKNGVLELDRLPF